MKQHRRSAFRIEIETMAKFRTTLPYWVLSVMLGLAQYDDGSIIGRLAQFQSGVRFFSSNELDLIRLMTWLLPHVLLSVNVGHHFENSLALYRYAIPRYGGIYQWWKRQCWTTYVFVLVYYTTMYLAIVVLSWLLGAHAIVGPISLYDHVSISPWVVLSLMLGNSVCVMCTLLTLQLAVQGFMRSSRVAIGLFLALILLTLFFPKPIEKYGIGSWLMIIRSELVSGESGYSLKTVPVICLFVVGSAHLMSMIAAHVRHNIW